MFKYIIHQYRHSPLMQRFAKGTSWSFLAGLVQNLSFLIIGLILSHMLGQYTYGQYGMIRSTINMFIGFSAFALGTTATKYVAQYRLTDKPKTQRIINLSLGVACILAIIAFLVCFIGSGYLATNTLQAPPLITPLRIASLMIVCLTLSSVVNGVLIGYEEFFWIFKQNAIAACFLIVCSAGASHLFQLNGALIGLLSYLVISLYLGIYYLRKIYIREKLICSLQHVAQEIKILWQFSLPSTLGGIVYTPVIWIANTILVNSSAGYEAMAGLDIIRQWYSAVLFVPTIAGRVVLPMLSNFSDQAAQHEYNKILTYSLLVNVGSGLLLALCLGLAATPILSLYGQSFLIFKVPFCIMMLVAVLFVANAIVGQIILSKNYAWWGFLFNSLWSIVFIYLNILFVKKQNMGVLGVALAYLISYGLHTLVQSGFSWFILRQQKVGRGN